MKRSPVLTAAALAAGVSLLAGCGVGQNAQTYQYKAQSNATDANAGLLMALRNVHVTALDQGKNYAKGDDATVQMVLVNSATTDDVLESASSPAAASIELKGADGAFVVPGGQAVKDYTLDLVGLTKELSPASFIDLTMVFKNAGSVSLSVPVRTSYSEPTKVPYQVGETGSAGKPLGDVKGESPSRDGETEYTAN